MHDLIAQIDERISRSNHVVLVPHRNPDADSLGAALAFATYLRGRGVAHSLFCATPIAQNYFLLPGMHILVDRVPSQTDVVCVFDAGDIRYAALDEITRSLKSPDIINIDHHASNEQFGTYNLVVTTAPSTTAVVYRFFDALQIRLDADTATLLLAGLLTDTGTFGNPATSPGALELGALLLRHGARISHITEILERTKPIGALRIWGLALSRLVADPATGIGSTAIFAAECAAEHVTDEHLAGLSNFLNFVGDCRATLVLKELPDTMIKGSLRTTRDEIDVAEIAARYGGGGHKKAAGFMTKGKIIRSERGWTIAQTT